MKRSLSFRTQKNLHPIVVGSAVIVGLTLLVSGTGKLPGQTEFLWALLQSFWTPAIAYFISYLLPWAEIGLGILLLLGIFPRIAAALFVPLAVGFMANNSWALMHGLENFPACGSCFGIWEEFLGTLSPFGALIFDIVLLCLTLVVLLLHQEKFLSFQSWFIRRKKYKSTTIPASRSEETVP